VIDEDAPLEWRAPSKDDERTWRSALRQDYCRQSIPLPSIWRNAAFQ